MIDDNQWSKLKPILLGLGIYYKPSLRTTFEGILYRLRVGCPWRDLPKELGDWRKVYKRFHYWSSTGKIQRFFKVLSQDPDLEWEFIDGSVIKAHQHSSGAPKNKESAIGKSVAGNSSKIHLAVDSYGLPIDFLITGGQVHDCKVAPEFIAALPPSEYKIADRGYDSENLRKQIAERGECAVIPRKKNSTLGNDDMDWTLYKYRHLVENAFARLKHFRALATRYDKLKVNYEATVALACAVMWFKM